MRSHRPPLTPVSVITTVIVLFMLGAIGSAQLFQFGEAKRRATCSNNLRQLALGVHVYADVNRLEIPPLATNEAEWSWVALISPYIEARKAYDGIDWKEPSPKSEAHKKLVAEFKHEALLCPSRRTKAARKEGDFKGGQPTDYMAVSTTDLKKFSTSTSGMIIYRAVPRMEMKGVVISRLKSAVTLGGVIDGTSNTAMIGEKHMLKDWLEGKYDEPALLAISDQNTIRIASDVEKDKEDAKPVEKLRGLAADDKDKDDWKFGSSHPGLCLFALGDASVRPVKNTTDPKILRLFCARADGETLKLPE